MNDLVTVFPFQGYFGERMWDTYLFMTRLYIRIILKARINVFLCSLNKELGHLLTSYIRIMAGMGYAAL